MVESKHVPELVDDDRTDQFGTSRISQDRGQPRGVQHHLSGHVDEGVSDRVAATQAAHIPGQSGCFLGVGPGEQDRHPALAVAFGLVLVPFLA
jgi:hypothetical protein